MARDCVNCGSKTDNPKFCSRSCSATFTNKANPKRVTSKKCIVCGEKVKSHRHNRCDKHWLKYKKEKGSLLKLKTLGEYRRRESVKGKGSSQINSHIRLFARKWFKDLAMLPCARCGYDKHVQLAHIKAVSDFSDDDRLCDVNSKENIVQLCPNCHWEFDNLSRVGFYK